MQGEGRAALASRDVMLGEQLPPLTLLFKDALGNSVPMHEVPAGLTFSLKAAPVSGQAAELEWEAAEVDVLASAQMVSPHSLMCCQCQQVTMHDGELLIGKKVQRTSCEARIPQSVAMQRPLPDPL